MPQCVKHFEKLDIWRMIKRYMLLPILNPSTPTKNTQLDMAHPHSYYSQTSNISHTTVGNKTVDHSDVVGASPVSAAPTSSSFST